MSEQAGKRWEDHCYCEITDADPIGPAKMTLTSSIRWDNKCELQLEVDDNGEEVGYAWIPLTADEVRLIIEACRLWLSDIEEAE